MLRRMLVKEWKEKFGLMIFALAGFLLFFVAASVYSKEPETLDILVSTILFIFLPAFSLLLGASGFASEFQDGAWAYLFSRPVRKWRIWLAKYVSLLTVLYAVVLLFDLLIRFHPALKTANKNFSFSLLGDLSHGQFVYLLPLLFFTTAFSLSIVSDKPFHVAFLAALIWIALQMALTRGIAPLLYRGPLYSTVYAIPIAFVILPLSFVSASLITLNRADFSQPRSRAWIFTKSAAILFLAFIILLSFFTFGVWKLRSERYVYNLEARTDAFYFATSKGFYKFNLVDGQTEKIAHYPSLWGRISIGGDKAAFVAHSLSGKQRGLAALRIMNIDGTEEKSLAETWDKESPLYGAFIYPAWVSPRGEKVAFIARSMPKKVYPELWMINSDGSGLRNFDLGITDAEFYRLISFGESGETLFLLCTIKIKRGNRDQRAGARLLRVDLKSGQVETLAEQIRKAYAASAAMEPLASGTGLIAYLHFDEAAQRDILTVLNPETLEEHQVYPEDSVTGFRWNATGDRLAFLTVDSKLGIYSAPEQKVVELTNLQGYDLRWPYQALEQTGDGRLILRKLEGGASYICLLDTNLTEQKAIRLPFATYYPARIWSAGNYVVVEDTEKHQLWGVDLETDKWLRVY